MRVIHKDEKQEEIKLLPQTNEDLWLLTKLVKEGDRIAARTQRRFKTRDLTRPDSGEKKNVFIEITAETIEYAETANKLRITGKILRGTPEEFVQPGEHHTLDVEPNEALTLYKNLDEYEKRVLQKALKQQKKVRIRIIVMDNEKATVAELTERGDLTFLYEIENEGNKRDPKTFEELNKQFFAEIMKAAEDAKEKTIIAGPGFAKDSLKKYVERKKPDLLKKIVFETASNAEQTGVRELLKKGALQKILGEQKIQEEYAALEEFKKRIANEGLACYGLEDVKNAVQSNAVELLMISDELLRKNKETQELVSQAEKQGSKIMIFDSETGQEFKTFKISALLRYKIR